MKHLSQAALFAFAVDQLSKLIVVHWMNLKAVLAVDVLPPFLVFRMGWNTGINFGLFAGNTDIMRWVLIAVAFIICGAILRWSRAERFSTRANIAAGFVVGGALANVLDRIIYGAVADFLNMSCCGFANPFSFNLADAFIFLGAVGLVIYTGDKKVG